MNALVTFFRCLLLCPDIVEFTGILRHCHAGRDRSNLNEIFHWFMNAGSLIHSRRQAMRCTAAILSKRIGSGSSPLKTMVRSFLQALLYSAFIDPPLIPPSSICLVANTNY